MDYTVACSTGVSFVRTNVINSRSFLRPAMFGLEIEWMARAKSSPPHPHLPLYLWPSTVPREQRVFAAHAPVNLCVLRVTAGMRLRRAYAFVSRQFSNRCRSSGARNTMARLFVFIVILVIFFSMLLGWKREKIEKWLRGMREKVQATLLSLNKDVVNYIY